jgi:hypothetical protein
MQTSPLTDEQRRLNERDRQQFFSIALAQTASLDISIVSISFVNFLFAVFFRDNLVRVTAGMSFYVYHAAVLLFALAFVATVLSFNASAKCLMVKRDNCDKITLGIETDNTDWGKDHSPYMRGAVFMA